MDGIKQEINVVELLMQIREDVSSIKTDMTNFKNNCKAESEITTKQMEKLEKQIEELKKKVEELEDREDKRDATRWRTVLAFVATAIGGMILSKIPDFLSYLTVLATVTKK